MWTSSYSKRVEGVSAGALWKVWSDVDRWPQWQDDVEATRMNGAFTAGSTFQFKPKGGPDLQLELTEVTPGTSFTDLTRFPLARMYDAHELVDHGDAVEIRTTVSIEGPLAFLWRKIVAENVAKGLPEQTERLIAQARYA